MSICYWTIEGIGIDTEKLVPYLNKRKLIDLILKQCPGDEETLAWKNCIDLREFDINDYFDGNPFDNLADLLTHCDNTDTISYGDDGDGGVYFYYPPSMPWHRKENEPESIEEVHKRIINAVMVVTDLTEKEIEALIDDDIYSVGCG